MDILKRFLDLSKLLRKKSHFLFGPRATGKTYLIRQQLAGRASVIDLLDSDIYLTLQNRPAEIRAMIDTFAHELVVIDEIQRIPELLNEVHRFLEGPGNRRFLLTGSSARRLKRENANMLGGRARRGELFPLTVYELKNEGRFDLERYLTYGGLPSVYLGEEPYEDLRAYVDNYLNEEVKLESNVRNLPNFSRFLSACAACNGSVLNFTKIGNDAQVHPNTVREHFEILKDTLLAKMVLPWKGGGKRKAISTPKFFFIDCGISHAIQRIKQLNPLDRGRAFEQAVFLEVNAYLSYNRLDEPLTFWRTRDQAEVDFIIGDHTAIEVKASSNVNPRDQKNLLKLAEERPFKHLLVISGDPVPKKYETGVMCLPLTDFVDRLWSRAFI
jgi:predicted AAA+ superfamily ATPase